MKIDEYLKYDGIGLAALLKSGAVSTRELMDCAVELAKKVDPLLNILCNTEYDAAVKWADSWTPTGPFRGIPFLLKDSGLPSVRLASGFGSKLFLNTKYSFNATLVERFEKAGLLAFARTTVPEFCMAPTTEADANGGPSRNPWNLSRSAGGSSGGSAAAVAAGIVPIAHGSDGGGSIRIPAACCGVFGLKPSRGLVPMGPNRGEGWGGLACDGVLSRSVRDTAAVLDAVAGMEIGAPYAASSLKKSYRDSISHSKREPLQIGIWSRSWSNIPIEPEVTAALNIAVKLCGDLGHEVHETPLPSIDYERFIQSIVNVMAANIKLSVDTRLQMLGRGLHENDLEPAIMDGYARGSALAASDYIKAVQYFHEIGRIFAASVAPFDLILTPALTSLPPKLGVLSMKNPSFFDFRQNAAKFTPFLAVVNAAGLPAASVPIYWTEENIPVACQLLAPFGREDSILSLASQLEEAAPWFHRRPTLTPC